MQRLILHYCILLASVLLSYWIRQHLRLPMWMLLLIVFAALEGITTLFLTSRIRHVRKENAEFRRAVQALSLEDARVRAFDALKSGSFRTKAASSARAVSHLPESAADIFSKHACIQSRMGSVLKLDGLDNGFADVGRTFDGAVLLLRLSDGALFESEDGKTPSADSTPDYPSIYHWLAFNA